MKKALRTLVALSSVICMLLALVACGNKAEPVNDETTTITEEPETSAAEDLQTEAETIAEEESTEEAAEEESSAVEEESKEEKTEKKAAIEKAPTEAADIIKLYNDTINTAFDKKVGFYKERICDNENLDAGIAFKTFKSLVYKFMGIGADNKYTETVTKGQWDSDAKRHYLRKSTLTAGDVSSADCAKSGDNYVITIKVNPGSSVGSASNRSASTPIDKCGICVGNEDKGYYDHKTGPVIYDAIDEAFSGATVNESYSNAVIKATVNGETGNLVKLTVEYDIQTTIDTGAIGKATATGTSHINYSNFVY